MQEDSTVEVGRKIERVAALARDSGLGGILIGAQHNFAWVTAGRSNRIDVSREAGSAVLAIGADGRRLALASAIERPRAESETLSGLGFQIREYPWADERADPSLPYRLAASALGAEALGADVVSPHARPIEGELAKIRATLDPDEIPRYRALGSECGQVVGTICRHSPPGSTETHVAARLAATLASMRITPLVVLVGADERIERFRHPVATDKRWRQRLLVVVCAERGGQVVALSRMVSSGSNADLANRMRAVTSVVRALLERTREGTTGAELYLAAAAAYATAGFPGEELRHHQGGAIGYRSREWVAHPRSAERVVPPQAFAWNPTVAGAKVEDTCLISADGHVEVMTETPEWPTIEIAIRGDRVRIADVLVLDA